jgi:SAM-dependent methyltransferase
MTTRDSSPSDVTGNRNLDPEVIAGFGAEWSRFDQSSMPDAEARDLFDAYFSLVPWDKLPPNAVAIDIGCGSGRWARLAASRFGRLHCVDPAAPALESARRNLAGATNVEFHLADAGSIPLPDDSADFAYSLGVLHHVPDTARALQDAVRKLKPGGMFLVYLYYALDNRPIWFRALWRTSDLARHAISRFSLPVRTFVTDLMAAFVYWPLARTARLLHKLGWRSDSFPLAAYRDRSFYVMRTDALDRFGTRLEQRFTRAEIEQMMSAASLHDIVFREAAPYWTALGVKVEN